MKIIIYTQAFGTFVLHYLPSIIKNEITIQFRSWWSKGYNLRQMCRMPVCIDVYYKYNKPYYLSNHLHFFSNNGEAVFLERFNSLKLQHYHSLWIW